jgi:hypothetical protein
MAITNIPRSFQFFNAVVATPPDFNLDAGIYGITAVVTGTVVLQKLLPDGITYVPVLPALAVTAGGAYVTVQLPAGQYRILMTAATITGEIAKIDRARS